MLLVGSIWSKGNGERTGELGFDQREFSHSEVGGREQDEGRLVETGDVSTFHVPAVACRVPGSRLSLDSREDKPF